MIANPGKARNLAAMTLLLRDALQPNLVQIGAEVFVRVRGEESGKMYKGLFKMADACERKTENLTSLFVTLLGPAVLVGIVMVVGCVILAMLMPIFQMNLIIN